jgi:hypothetical protein
MPDRNPTGMNMHNFVYFFNPFLFLKGLSWPRYVQGLLISKLSKANHT